jgi:hypothetical protein
MNKSAMRNVAYALVAFLLFNSTSGRAEDQAPKSELFMNPITAALKWFSDVQEYYGAHQIEPAAREQSIRYLRKLNNSLSDLEINKQEFTEALRTAEFPRDGDALGAKAQELSASVWEVRRKLSAYTNVLPADFQTSATQINANLSNGLADKCAKLNFIAEKLTGHENVHRDQLVKMGEDTVKKIQELESKVSAVIQELATAKS